VIVDHKWSLVIYITSDHIVRQTRILYYYRTMNNSRQPFLQQTMHCQMTFTCTGAHTRLYRCRPLKAAPCRGIRGHPPPENFWNIQVSPPYSPPYWNSRQIFENCSTRALAPSTFLGVVGQKHQTFWEFRTPFPRATSAKFLAECSRVYRTWWRNLF